MFTGIITDIGRVRSVGPAPDRRIEIETAYDCAAITLGASIACSGASGLIRPLAADAS